ncbi:hypothetical protein KEU06_06300 [Pseudaminobacter sp. 19-2017]|uniref:Lipoprotein n=1 Tax=Pseudaminobacter soli (ex Zhang et al. 2022) TaxID=2831468 RepID=A0A942DZX3_9HYPH|nr:hypothetical protein [Pseudaminobacter soli]
MPGLIVSGLILVVAGCQSGTGGSPSPGSAGTDTKPPEGKVLESELRGYCPRVSLREGTNYVNSYAKGGQDDPSKLQYQASISDVTRSCSRSNGMLNITVAVAGRVVPGPAGAPANITLPIRVAVLEGGNVTYSELKKHQVQLAGGGAAGQFIVNEASISVPEPSAANVQIFAGFDEGPPKKRASTE